MRQIAASTLTHSTGKIRPADKSMDNRDLTLVGGAARIEPVAGPDKTYGNVTN